MDNLPIGTVTFLFTDVEGSTRLWDQHPEAARRAMFLHDRLVEQTATAHGGQVVRPRGEGDSRFVVFARATDGLEAAAAVQQALAKQPWPTPTPLKVRVALHTGEADLWDGDDYGSAVNRCARLRSIAHGGQTLVSGVTADLARDTLTAPLALKELGSHRLKNLTAPERVYQVVHPELPNSFPPLRSLDAIPNNLPLQLTSFVGREREVAEVKRLLEAVRLLTLTSRRRSPCSTTCAAARRWSSWTTANTSCQPART